jgi:glutamate synthase domain-containing protein 2
VAKSIICGADLTAIDLPLLFALECRYCKDCLNSLPCPVELKDVKSQWAAQRIINLIGAWRNQLLEVLGAMGLREVRRLRGEVGRAIFFEEIEKETFDKVFVSQQYIK